MFLAQKHVKDITLTRIGECIGGRDHTTVLHSCKLVMNQLNFDKELSDNVTTIEKALLKR